MWKAIPRFAKKRVESDHVRKWKTINLKVDHRREKSDTTHLASLQWARSHDHTRCRLTELSQVKNMHVNNEMTSLLTLTKLLTFCHVSLPELDSSQSVLKPLFHQSAQISGGAGQRLVLEDRPLIRGKADRTSFPQAPAAGRSLLQDSARPALIQVNFLSPRVVTVRRGWGSLLRLLLETNRTFFSKSKVHLFSSVVCSPCVTFLILIFIVSVTYLNHCSAHWSTVIGFNCVL